MRAMDMVPYDQLNLIAILWWLLLPVALFVLTVIDAGWMRVLWPARVSSLENEFGDPVDVGPATSRTVLSALRGRGHAGGLVCCLPAVTSTNYKSSRRN